MLFTDLRELKKILEIDPRNTEEDLNLSFYIEWASRWIEDLLCRPDLEKKERIQYYNGTGTLNLILRCRPVYTTPTIVVRVDQGGYFGAVSGSFNNSGDLLTYGQDYVLNVDQDDGTSRSAILYRIGNFWPKQSYRQGGLLTPYLGVSPGSIQVTYTAGYTVDTLPAMFRMACNTLASRMRNYYPLAQELNSESYEARSLSYQGSVRDHLTQPIKQMLFPYVNRSW